MATQSQVGKERNDGKGQKEGDSVVARARARAEEGKKIADHAKEVVDQIDEVLTENAEEFVKTYVQKGGE